MQDVIVAGVNSSGSPSFPFGMTFKLTTPIIMFIITCTIYEGPKLDA